MEILLSLIMIVRNEETRLPQCLESVRDEVDEIIIVDTGSSDRTLDVAKNYTEKVYTFPWNHDFSDARNYALRKAKGEWVLSLDADEWLESKPQELRSLILAHPEIEAYLLPLYNPISDDTEEYNVYHVLRLFRNNGVYRFTGKIHEHVLIPNDHVVDLASSPIIYHQFLPLPERNRKRERNIKALKQCLNSDPQNPFLHYYLGTEWMMLNKPKRALPYFEYAYSTLPQDMLLFRTSSLRYCVIALDSLGETYQALELILEGNANYPHYADLLYLGGVLFREIQEYSLAVKWLKEAISSGPPPSLYSHLTGTENFLAYFQLGICYEKLGEKEQALTSYLTSLQANPAYTISLYPLMNLYLEQYSPQQTLHFLRTQNLLEHPLRSLTAARIFHLIGYPDLALSSLVSSDVFEFLVLLDGLDGLDGIDGLDGLSDLNGLKGLAGLAEFASLGGSGRSAFKDGLSELAKYLILTGEIRSSLKILNSLLTRYQRKTLQTDETLLAGIQVPRSLAYLLMGNFREARSIALELWKNHASRCEGTSLLALTMLMETGRLAHLPHFIRESSVESVLKQLYQDFFNYLPLRPQNQSPHYSQMMEGLQTLLKAHFPQGTGVIEEHLDMKIKQLCHDQEQRFGIGWISR